ncbi:hypothetical protein M8818_001123 [Zalaria obscura]|uniref:Uncharacterized protein n=1 Tax=Zalaria obscura TaxID=2024903 RepID=A0ACC3SLV8_9PEZI
MYAGSLLTVAAVALFVAAGLAQDDPDSTCLSYGIDFVNGNEYFINENSTADFTFVSQFNGCNNDTAYAMLSSPTGDEYDCSDVPTVPSLVSEMSTCDIEKDQMYSGWWLILILGNNLNGNPFAYQRNVSLDVGIQQTTTVRTVSTFFAICIDHRQSTPTITYTQSVTPTVNITSTSTVLTTTTVPAKTTIVEPSKTAYRTVTPKPRTTTSVKTITRTLKKWTKTFEKDTVTVTARCTVPPRPQQPDPTCKIKPTLKALPSGVHIDIKRSEDTLLDPAVAKQRYENMRARRAQQLDQRDMVKRSADVPTVTVTATQVVNTTITQTAAATTFTSETITTKTVKTTAKPSTIYSGIAVKTITAPTPVKTAYKIKYTTTWTTTTWTAHYTSTKTVTPTASVTACKKSGGHFGGGWGIL